MGHPSLAPMAPLLVWHLLQVMVEVRLRQEGNCQVSTKESKTTLESIGDGETSDGSGQCDSVT